MRRIQFTMPCLPHPSVQTPASESVLHMYSPNTTRPPHGLRPSFDSQMNGFLEKVNSVGKSTHWCTTRIMAEEEPEGCFNQDDSPFSFFLAIFHWEGTVFESIWRQILCAGLVATGVAIWAQHGLSLGDWEFWAGNEALGACVCVRPVCVWLNACLVQLRFLRCWSCSGTTCPTLGTMKADMRYQASAQASGRWQR